MGLAQVHRELGDAGSGRRLLALETSYQSLLQLQRLGSNTDRLELVVPDVMERMVEATLFQFYQAMSSPSTLDENAFYADEVVYFGEVRDRSEILDMQREYRKKYPNRIFRVMDIQHSPESQPAVFRVAATLDYWLANPKKENDIDFDAPDGEMAQRIGFSFDEFDRLRIFEIGSADNP